MGVDMSRASLLNHKTFYQVYSYMERNGLEWLSAEIPELTRNDVVRQILNEVIIDADLIIEIDLLDGTSRDVTKEICQSVAIKTWDKDEISDSLRDWCEKLLGLGSVRNENFNFSEHRAPVILPTIMALPERVAP